MREPWGKLDRSNPERRLSLVGHCIDVAAVVRALLDLPTWKRRFDALAGRPLSAVDIDRLTVLAFWHDVGKAGAGFYAKGASDEERAAWQRQIGGVQGQTGHTRVVAPLLPTDDLAYQAHRDALGIDALWTWGHDARALWLAAVSHHGDPLTESDLLNIPFPFPTWTQPVAGYEPVQGLARLGHVARTLWATAFVDEPMRPVTSALIHGFAGLVSFADWVGSKADDDRFFPYNFAMQDEGRWKPALARARDVLRRLAIDVEASRADLAQRSPSFIDVFGFEPRDVQSAAAAPELARLVVLEAETGSGKTEAALWRFKTLFQAGEVDALSFLLPTRVAATGIYQRMHEFLTKLWPEPQAALRPNIVLAVPGDLRANGIEGTLVAPYAFQWPDDEVRRPLYWAAENSKRYFAAAVATATIDQFLLSTLRTRHSHLRGTVLLRSLVVVDEVHASDRYMRALLVAGLRRHLASGGHAMLLSATLASDMRDELLRTAPTPPTKRGFARASSLPRTPETIAGAGIPPFGGPDAQTDYPRLTSPGRPDWIGCATSTKAILREVRRWMRDADAVARLAAEAVHQGARVLIIRNTVGQAIATQRALEALLGGDHPALFRCGEHAVLHHGRYALPDRLMLDAEVGRRYGKDAYADERACVLVGTQTLEISVDCDADFLITDLAPMDVLLQRIGRLHRHQRRSMHRPAAFQEHARCIILTPPDSDLAPLLKAGAARGLGIGLRTAYPDLICLQATLFEIEDLRTKPIWHIPEHNRELVERCCNANVLHQVADRLGPLWAQHLSELTGKKGGEATLANVSTVVWEKPWEDASSGELQIDARTRLGLDGMDLDLPGAPCISALGQSLERLTLPAWMLRTRSDIGAAALPIIESLRHDAGALRFTVADQSFVYDRWGLRPEVA